MVQNANHPALTVYPLPPGGGNSDFVCFREKGVPFLYFHTGLHDQYHTPADDVELINFPGLVDIGQVSLRVLTRLMVMEGAK